MGYSWVEREGQREQAEREGQREQSPRGMTPHTQVETKSTCSMHQPPNNVAVQLCNNQP